ncbi:Adenine phosphoribosyltransferase 1 chloroplastic [Bienertia sinuspersici]
MYPLTKPSAAHGLANIVPKSNISHPRSPRPFPSIKQYSSAINSNNKLTLFNSLYSSFHHNLCRSVCVRRVQVSSPIKMALDSEPSQDARIARISSSIRVIPNFPKPGVMFQDITTMLLDPKAFKDTIDLFVERYKDKDISVVAGVEARGFIFGPPIALAIGAKFVPMRKPGKLPGEVISEEYSLEYGTDKMEMHVGAVEAGERAIVIDDLIATGGTLSAAIKLLERVGLHVVESACVIELPELKGRDRLGDKPLFVLIKAA